MNFQEFALKNLSEMKTREPTPQNMRDVALLEIWLKLVSNEDINSPYSSPSEEIKKETREILPAYNRYIEDKRKYQLKEIPKERVIYSFKTLSDELADLLKLIYRNTDLTEERNIFYSLLEQLNKI